MSFIRQSYILFANGRMNLLAVKVVPMEKSPAWIDSDRYTGRIVSVKFCKAVHDILNELLPERQRQILAVDVAG
jgi:hypothetical protein